MDKEIIWSWSRLNSFNLAEKGEGCYHSYNLAYNHGDRGENNYFTEYGLLVHETIEKLHKGELIEWDLEDELKHGLAALNYKPPFPRMGDSYTKALFRYFLVSDFAEQFKDYEILESEEEATFEVHGHKLRGFPDLVANHKEYGLIIGDYKTSKVYAGDKLKNNIQQLYLYSIPIKEKYGRYPDHLTYIYPREEGKREYVYKFDMDELERTKQFVVDVIDKISKEKENEWIPRCESVDGFKDFYASQLCNQRNSCQFRNAFNEKAV